CRGAVMNAAAGVRCGTGRSRGASRGGGDRRDTRACGELERAALELFQRSLVLKENYLAIGFAALLKPDAALGHRGVANQSAVRINAAFADREADDEAALPNCGENRVPV